jgi:hypothetical protein
LPPKVICGNVCVIKKENDEAAWTNKKSRAS